MRDLLRSARRSAGYTQYQLADALGISRSYYSQIETGMKEPTFEIVLRIKLALKQSSDGLFENRACGPLKRGAPFKDAG